MRFLLFIPLTIISAFQAMAQDEKKFTPSEEPYLIKSIFFDGGRYYIDEEQVDGVMEFFSGVILENYEIHIHSHTDNVGSIDYNRWLSRMRSEATYEMLQYEGIPMDQIYIKDHGLFNPEFDNKSWEGRRKNRRVDIVLWPLPS